MLNVFCQSSSSAPGGFADRGEDAGAEVALVGDGVGGIQGGQQAGVADGAGVVGAPGCRVADVQ